MNAEVAKAILVDYNIPINVDFFTLTDGHVKDLTNIAALYKYKRPKNSQGSKARHFYKELMRHFKEDK